MSSAIQTVSRTVQDNIRELSSGGKIVKKILLGSNVVVMLFGLLLIIVGGVAAGGQFNGLTSTTLASGIIVIGVFVMLIAFLGCWGSMTESKKLLYIFFGLLVFFAVVEFAVGIAAYVKKDDLPAFADTLWTTLYNTDRNSINDLENSFKCCGWNNITDRAVPPFGTEVTCAQLYMGVPSCSLWWEESLYELYGGTSQASRLGLQNFQNTFQCCGWDTLTTPSFFFPWDTTTNQTCQSANPSYFKPCKQAIQDLWYAHSISQSVVGDAWIQSQQSAFIQNSCCGWLTNADAAVPPSTANTCFLTKGFTNYCSDAVDQALSRSLQITGGVGVALGVLQILVIVMTLVLIVKIPGKSHQYNDDAPREQIIEEED